MKEFNIDELFDALIDFINDRNNNKPDVMEETITCDNQKYKVKYHDYSEGDTGVSITKIK